MNISVLNIAYTQHGAIQYLHPTLIEANGQYFLTDTGYENTLAQLRAALQQKGIDIINLTGIIISHDDIDHLGALNDIKKMNPLLQVYCSKTEEPSVTGRLKQKDCHRPNSCCSSCPKNNRTGERIL